jgi:hypothetical protein
LWRRKWLAVICDDDQKMKNGAATRARDWITAIVTTGKSKKTHITYDDVGL